MAEGGAGGMWVGEGGGGGCVAALGALHRRWCCAGVLAGCVCCFLLIGGAIGASAGGRWPRKTRNRSYGSRLHGEGR